MPDAGHSPTGETTLPPPPVPAGAAGDVEVLPPPPADGPRPAAVPLPPGKRRRRPFRWWVDRLLPVFGLALMLGCLYGLLDGTLPDWTFGGSQIGPPPGPGTRTPGGPPAVVIDPGHGGIDTGATALGLQEKALNLDVALRVARLLERQGFPVLMTRTTDQAVSLEDRVRIANAAPGTVFVSIHFNDSPGSDHHASGVETYFSEHKEAGVAGDWMWTSLFGRARNASAAAQRDALAWSVREGALLADAIQGSLVMATSAADRGTKERGLYVTRRVRGPAVLVEGGFINHPTEGKRLGEPAYRQKLAEAIANGIVRYLETAGRQPVPGDGSVPPAGA